MGSLEQEAQPGVDSGTDEYDAEVAEMANRKKTRKATPKAKPAGDDKITRRARPKYDDINLQLIKDDLKPLLDPTITDEPIQMDFRGYGRSKRTAGSGNLS